MDRRLVAIRKIEFAFAFIVARVKLSNKLNFIDINIVAEDFLKLFESNIRIRFKNPMQ